MGLEGEGIQNVPRALRDRQPFLRTSYRLVLASFVVAYGAVEALLTLSVAGLGAFYPEALALLILLAAGVFVGGLLESGRAAQRFYLALSIVPGLTVARFAFAGGTVLILDPVFLYLLLAVTILVLRDTANVSSGLEQLRRGQLPRALAVGAALATGFAVLGILVSVPGVQALQAPLWIYVAVIPPAAFLDELWFRGILQRGLAVVTSARWGWLATVAVFAAYGAPFGNPVTFVFRLATGFVFGAVAIRRENLPIVLVARTVVAAALVILNPSVAGGTSLII